MATYYKYADREASSQVNWSEITSNMVNSLKEVQTIRDSKRKAIDDATAELSTTLSEAPQGSHKGLNEFAMNYANNAQEMRLMQDKLLKSGQLKLRDYNIGRANLTQGTTQLFNLGKKYQAIYGERMEKFQNGETSQLDADALSRLEGFANFSNHEAYINPTNGQVSMGKLIDKKIGGKVVRTMDRTPGSFTTVQQLNFSLSQEIQKYKIDDLNAQVATFADTYLTTDGAYSSLDDVRQMPAFKEMVNDIIQTQVQVPNQVGSILKDFVGGYDTVYNKEFQNENAILMVEDPNQPGSGKMIMDVESEIGKKQKKKAEEWLKRQIEKQLPSKQTTKAPTKPTAAEIERKERMDKEDYQVSNVGKLMTGDETDMQTLTDYFSTLNSATQSVKRTSDGIVVAYRNPVTNEIESHSIPFYVGEGKNKKAKTVAQFIESASSILTGNKDIRTILKRGNYDKDAVFNEKLTGEYISQVKKESANVSSSAAIDRAVFNRFDKIYAENDDDEAVMKAIKEDEEFLKLGIIATDTGKDSFDVQIPGVSGIFKITEDNISTKMPEILREAYKKLGLKPPSEEIKKDKGQSPVVKATEGAGVIDGSKYNKKS